MKSINILTLFVFFVCVLGCQSESESVDDFLLDYRNLVQEEKYAQARESLRRGIRRFPDSIQLRIAAGRLALVMGDAVAAEVAFRRAVDMGADSESTVSWLAAALIAQGDYPKVLQEIQPLCAQLSSDLPRVECQLATIEAMLNTPNQDQIELIRRYIGVLEVLAQSPSQPLDVKVSQLRASYDAAEAAHQHFACRIADQVTDKPKKSLLSGKIWQVGPQREVKTIAEVAGRVKDGDTVEIAAGVYRGDVAVWRANNIHIRGVGGRPHLMADGMSALEKGTWAIEGNNYVVENVEISGAVSKDKNGAAIRMHGDNLTVRNSYFHDNQNGILTARRYDSDIRIENSEFARNGFGRGYTHNIYIGHSKRFTLIGSYSHQARVGHLVKSRATENWIIGNRLTDEKDGNSSMLIDISEGGKAYIIGNELQQGVFSENRAFIAYGAEGGQADELLVLNNSFYNQAVDAVFVANFTQVQGLIVNNLFAGAPAELSTGPHQLHGNMVGPDHGMESPREYRFKLTSDSRAIDAAVSLEQLGLSEFAPQFEYQHGSGARSRLKVASLDVGAHEFCGFTGTL